MMSVSVMPTTLGAPGPARIARISQLAERATTEF
jgi:hypothetical protein